MRTKEYKILQRDKQKKLQAHVKAEYKGVLTTTLSSKRRKIGQFIHTGGQSGEANGGANNQEKSTGRKQN